MSQLAFLLPLFPFLAFALIVFFTNKNHRLSAYVAVGGILASALVAYSVLAETAALGAGAAQKPLGAPDAISWFPYGTGTFFMGWMVDPLAAVMLFMVTTVCLMIFIYSIGYMQEGHADEHGHIHVQDDPRYSRFFALISLFAGAMLALVISPNYLLFFMAWELMGYCSYALIGFWSFRTRDEHHIDDPQVERAKYAAIKAFMTTRVGDVLFFSGILLLFVVAGTLDMQKLFTAEKLEELSHAMSPIAGLPWINLIGLLFLGGAIGKSAQFPLHIWLPDAMEGPTPVSALIHAATMVAAGVYLIARSMPLFITTLELNAGVAASVALVGAFTAAFAATIAIAQDDIKRVIAYSTISQLGYMIAALGIFAYGAGAFHLFTHSFFKALLFLAAGAVIHGAGTNDMMKMGGLMKKMPITAWTFIIGALALMGIPPFAGFWSKDEILGEAMKMGLLGGHSEGIPIVAAIVYLLLLAAAFLTAFYTTRQICLTFLGKPREDHVYDHAHESPPVMWGPLVVLAFFAFAIGFVNLPGLQWFGGFVGTQVMGIHTEFEVPPFDVISAAISVVVAIAGIGLGWLIYGRRPVQVGERDPLTRLGPIWTLLRNKYYLDELYGFAIRVTGAAVPGLLVRFSVWIADVLFAFDRYVIDALVNLAGAVGRFLAWLGRLIDVYVVDGAVNGFAFVTGAFAGVLRLIQTGRVQNYLLIAFAGVALIVLAFLAGSLALAGG